MKKFLTLLCLFTALANISFAKLSYHSQRETLAYPISLLKKSDEADKARAFQFFKDVENFDLAKIYIAYCHFTATGTEQDSLKANSLINSIDNTETLGNFLSSSLYSDNLPNLQFSLLIADSIYAKTKDFKKAYENFINRSDLKKKDADAYKRIVALAELDERKNAKIIIENLLAKEDYESAIKRIKHLDDMDKHYASEIFAGIIKNEKKDLIKTIIKELENCKIEEGKYGFELAYCYYYGVGVQEDKLKALDILKKNLTKGNSPLIALTEPYRKHEMLIDKNTITELMFIYAKMQFEAGKNYLYLRCLTYGLGTEIDLNTVVKIKYKALIEKKEPTRVDILIDEARWADEREILIDLYERELNRPISNFPASRVTKAPKDKEKEPRKFDSSKARYVTEYSFYLMNGVACEKKQDKAIDLLKSYYAEIAKIAKDKILFNNFLVPLEYLAYYYDKGIYFEKDEEKAKAIRADIDKYAQESLERFCYYNIWQIYEKTYSKSRRDTSKISYSTKISDDEMESYYDKKRKEFEEYLKQFPEKKQGAIISL